MQEFPSRKTNKQNDMEHCVEILEVFIFIAVIAFSGGPDIFAIRGWVRYLASVCIVDASVFNFLCSSAKSRSKFASQFVIYCYGLSAYATN